MKSFLAGAVTLLAALALTVPAAEPTTPVPEILLLGDAGPVRIRLNATIDGQPHAAAWERYLDKLFADLDVDGDGALSKAELARAPTADFLQSFLQGSLNLEAAAEQADVAKLDADRDGRISRAELRYYYIQCGFDRLRYVLAPSAGDAGGMTAALFGLLDADRDGLLSAAELQRAGAALRRADVNDDEWITPNEVLARSAPEPAKAGPAPTFLSTGLLPPAPEAPRQLAEHYRTKLDGPRLAALLTKGAPLELTARLGKLTGDQERVVVQGESPLAKVESVDGVLTTAAAGLTLAMQAAPADGRVRGLHAFYRQQFEAADAAGQGALLRKQVLESPTLAALFRLADRDGDGKLTTAELDAFLDLHALGAVSFVTLTVADQSLGLFDLLDADHDGRLSLRDLHTAWDRLRGHDRDGDGKLSRSELPRRLQASIGLGKPAVRPPAGIRPAPAPVARRGPAWFQKMDRNGDGSVSRREFLGPLELFTKLDADGDGLLSPEEADRAVQPD